MRLGQGLASTRPALFYSGGHSHRSPTDEHRTSRSRSPTALADVQRTRSRHADADQRLHERRRRFEPPAGSHAEPAAAAGAAATTAAAAAASATSAAATTTAAAAASADEWIGRAAEQHELRRARARYGQRHHRHAADVSEPLIY